MKRNRIIEYPIIKELRDTDYFVLVGDFTKEYSQRTDAYGYHWVMYSDEGYKQFIKFLENTTI